MTNELKEAVVGVRMCYEEPTSDPEATDHDIRMTLRKALGEALTYGGESPFTALETAEANTPLWHGKYVEEKYAKAFDRELAKIEPLQVVRDDEGTISTATVRLVGFELFDDADEDEDYGSGPVSWVETRATGPASWSGDEEVGPRTLRELRGTGESK